MSVVFRYIVFHKNENKEIIQVECKESFTGFYPITHDRSAEGLKKFVIDFLQEKHIPIRKCRGQGCNGAAVTSSAYSGLQSKIVELEKNAQYVHCAAHNLNLVINDASIGSQRQKVFSILLVAYIIFFRIV